MSASAPTTINVAFPLPRQLLQTAVVLGRRRRNVHIQTPASPPSLTTIDILLFSPDFFANGQLVSLERRPCTRAQKQQFRLGLFLKRQGEFRLGSFLAQQKQQFRPA
jgi:hypothetical protein